MDYDEVCRDLDLVGRFYAFGFSFGGLVRLVLSRP